MKFKIFEATDGSIFFVDTDGTIYIPTNEFGTPQFIDKKNAHLTSQISDGTTIFSIAVTQSLGTVSPAIISAGSSLITSFLGSRASNRTAEASVRIAELQSQTQMAIIRAQQSAQVGQSNTTNLLPLFIGTIILLALGSITFIAVRSSKTK